MGGATSALVAVVFPPLFFVPLLVSVTIPTFALLKYNFLDVYIDPDSEEMKRENLRLLTDLVISMGPLVKLPTIEVITPSAFTTPRKARTEAQRVIENRQARERYAAKRDLKAAALALVNQPAL